MIEYNSIIIEFVNNNWLMLTLVFTLLKGVAKITPWAWDDSIVSLLFGLFKTVQTANTIDVTATTTAIEENISK